MQNTNNKKINNKTTNTLPTISKYKSGENQHKRKVNNNSEKKKKKQKHIVMM